MNRLLTTSVLLAMYGAANAQTPPVPARPPAPAVSVTTVRSHSGREDRAPTEDEELALAALEGLMAQPGDRALPIIKKVLAGQQSTMVKQRALFVLSQIDSPEARQILVQTSRSTDAGLRDEAIRAIGISGDPKSLDLLQDAYKTGGPDVKEQVLQAWMIAGRKEAVYQAALNATSEDEANDAIRMLGVMGAADELRKLGDRPKTSRGLIEAWAISGDLASLRKVADTNSDPTMRVEAVQKIGIIGSDQARAALREIYSRATDAQVREAALQGMMISDDEKGILELYRAAKTSDEKRVLLRYLSMLNGDAALQAIDAALEDKK